MTQPPYESPERGCYAKKTTEPHSNKPDKTRLIRQISLGVGIRNGPTYSPWETHVNGLNVDNPNSCNQDQGWNSVSAHQPIAITTPLSANAWPFMPDGDQPHGGGVVVVAQSPRRDRRRSHRRPSRKVQRVSRRREECGAEKHRIPMWNKPFNNIQFSSRAAPRSAPCFSKSRSSPGLVSFVLPKTLLDHTGDP